MWEQSNEILIVIIPYYMSKWMENPEKLAKYIRYTRHRTKTNKTKNTTQTNTMSMKMRRVDAEFAMFEN